MISRRTLFGSTLGVGVGALAGCQAGKQRNDEPKPTGNPRATSSAQPTKSGATPPPTKQLPALTLGLTYIPNVQFAPFYYAKEQGLFAQHGVDVTLRHHGAQEGLFQALRSGQEQVVVASSDEAMVASTRDAPIETFSTLYHRYPVRLFHRIGCGVYDPRDLVGPKIGVPGRFGSSWYGLLSHLYELGLKADDLNIVEVGYSGISAFLTDKVTYFVGFANNEPIQLKAQNMTVAQWGVTSDFSPSLVGAGLMTTPKYRDNDSLRALADAVLEAQRAIGANPSLGLQATQAYVPDLSEVAAQNIAKGVLDATIELWRDTSKNITRTINRPAFERMATRLRATKIIDKPADVAKLIRTID